MAKQVVTYTVNKDEGISDPAGGYRVKANPLEFLLQDNQDALKAFSDLDRDVASLLGLLNLTPKQLETLAREKSVWASPYILQYIPNKYFSIAKGTGQNRPYAGFSDLSQYGKCTSNEVMTAYNELGLYPRNLISPANVYRREVFDKLNLPSCDDVPIEALKIAYECCKGNWVESYQLGHWDKVYDYDINSAYPFQASLLLDLRQGKWLQSKDYQPEAIYGYCRCEVMIDTDFSPIIWQKDDKNYTPKGVFQTSLTKAQIDFIYRRKLGYTTILDGWWWSFEDIVHQPLALEIDRLYQEKLKATGLKREIIKRIMSGCFYGLFLETRGDEFGEFFLSPWAAEIETRTQLEIAEACLCKYTTPLHVSVDGFVTDRPIMKILTPIPSIDEMGGWRLNSTGKCLIASSGLVALENVAGEGDFSIDYNWLMEQIKANPQATSYQKEKYDVLTLGKAYQEKRLTEVGNRELITRSVDFGDSKREYPELPQDWEELVQAHWLSKPWDFTILKALEAEVDETIIAEMEDWK